MGKQATNTGATFMPDDLGSFIPGVPTRDLAPDEWAALDKEVQQLCLASKLYVMTKDGATDG